MGWKVEKQRSNQKLQEECFLGPHSPKLKVGDVKKLMFSETDEGSYCLKGIVCEACRYDKIIGEKVQKWLK
jgi:hypothetical protein